MSENPYSSNTARAFWRSAIASRETLDIGDLWRPKFPIRLSDKTVTAGSCFAQHISRAMQSHGFSWLDLEPAPPVLSDDSARAFNYGIFSFRTGNIYTVALLRQWLGWALGREPQSQEVWVQDGRFFDPVRPQIEPGGFASLDEMNRARAVTLEAISRALREADIFVFTLGLTEGWENAATGLCYATCPGTVGGSFDASAHHLVNYDYPHILRDMTEVVGMAREVNPDLRFLLTVSPVPLTATAEDEHVLVATTYSKSTLRAVAGDLARSLDGVDYFPSYEIISSFPFRGMFYEGNLRQVRADGVSFVMRQFFAGIGHETEATMPAAEPAAMKPVEPANQDDIVCEEEILDFYNQH